MALSLEDLKRNLECVKDAVALINRINSGESESDYLTEARESLLCEWSFISTAIKNLENKGEMQ